ncbi:glycosyltransferase [Pseudoalteromonas sp. APC 3907]|uniref:glycosyltransferase n=2 Tax=unclassified Pseudoalteromonas TaxID=194690 RepID=UPI0025B31617|nr:glycosyltransferase [Pseudoalteromonas sp. APC 3907]MDN3431526.1 glycosyltransferase [Pseudoalteromonas sp. APC 3907]
MKILHIHQDFPDGRNYPYTKAVSNLIEEAETIESRVEHTVLSINRTSNPFKVSIKKFDKGLSVVYWAIPLKFIYKPMIYFWSYILCLYLSSSKYNLVHGHKLTTEGLFTYYISKRLNIHYVLSVRGGSDKHNMNRLSDCKNIFSKVYRESRAVFYVSPWFKKFVESYCNYNHENIIQLPNICKFQDLPIDDIRDNSTSEYVIILSFHQYKRKGLVQLLHAVKELKDQGRFIKLKIIGTGEEKYIKLVRKMITELSLSDVVDLVGPLKHKQVLSVLRNSKAFLLPSKNETFGMTYVESLASGCPILYLSNTGIDGHLDGVDAGIKIDDNDIQSIKNSLINFESNYKSIALDVKNLIGSSYLSKFKAEEVAGKYISTIKKIN